MAGPKLALVAPSRERFVLSRRVLPVMRKFKPKLRTLPNTLSEFVLQITLHHFRSCVFPSSDPGAEEKWANTTIYSANYSFCLYFAGFVLPAIVFFKGFGLRQATSFCSGSI